MTKNHVIDELYQRIEHNRNAPLDKSYSAQLLAGAPTKPARKLVEEATEMLIEALKGDKDALIKESADMIYHMLVTWCACNITPQEVWDELNKRQNQSGLEEKQNRIP